MTEDEWAEAEEDVIWAALRPLGDRRHRLLAVALVRSLGHWADLDVARDALAAAEKFADTGKSKAALKRARESLADARVALVGPGGHTLDRAILGTYMALWVAGVACSEAGAGSAVRETVRTWREAELLLKAAARRRVYPVFREVAGPDAPGTFDPAWPDTALALATQMYTAGEFSAMPILADALQDAGCDSEPVLTHCRDLTRVHARGCWVIDRVLGRS
jgi:hypothetical protein